MKKIAVILSVISLFFSHAAFADNKNCLLSTGINVQTLKQRLYICEQGKVTKMFKIALGRKGTDKKREGDGKTPSGLYALDFPTKSKRFEIFIPIQYPTLYQLSAGYTGKNVGIHGPFRLLSWLGNLNTVFNWTQGCITVGNYKEIVFIATWVKTHPRAKILIE